MKSVRRTGAIPRIRPDHAGISVADLEASIAWYSHMLGFEHLRTVDIPDAENAGRVALIKNGDFILELFCLPAAAPLPQERRDPITDIHIHGVKHVAYAVGDLDALVDSLKAKGVDLVWDIAVHDGTRCAFVRDNTGNLVEFVERPSNRRRSTRT